MSDKPTQAELQQRLDAFEIKARRFGSVSYRTEQRALRSGFSCLEQDDYLRAGEPDLVIVGARPGTGKTSFVVQALVNIARSEGPTLLFSLEMSSEQLRKRSMSAETGTPISQLHMLSQTKLEAANAAMDAIPFFVDDTRSLDILQLRASALAVHRKHPLKAVGVDYLQLVKSLGRDKREQVGNVAEGLKQLALDIRAPVIALAQMSRDIEKRQQTSKSARPTMSDIQESSLVENVADQILFLDGAGKRDPLRAGEIDVYAAKNRHGRCRDFILFFAGDTTKFSDFEGGL